MPSSKALNSPCDQYNCCPWPLISLEGRMQRTGFTWGINRILHCYHSKVITTSGLSNNSSGFAPELTWQRAELFVRVPWEVPEPLFSSYLGQGQPYQITGLWGFLSPRSISLPPEEKGQPSLPPLFHLEPSSPPSFGPQHSTFPVGVCKARITLRPQLVCCQKH